LRLRRVQRGAHRGAPLMAETTVRTLVCSVLFLDIVDYSKRPIGDQQHMKQTFNELLSHALEPVPPRDFIVLDTGDGAAIAFLGDPEHALSAGIAVRKSIASLPPEILSLRMGINLGPVRLVWDINAQMNILGDGINVAQRVMSFAEPGELLASRSFYDVVSGLSKDYAIVFGSSKAAVEEALERLGKGGAEVTSHITQVGDKWMASCTNPKVNVAECKVEVAGLMRIITGPTREAVDEKVCDLVQFGAVLVSDIELNDGVWTAVCDTGGRSR